MKAIRKLKWIFLALILIGLKGNEVFAQAEDGPISGYTDVVYFNLDAGDVTISSSTATGYRWNGTTPQKFTYSASSSALYYIYQTRPNTSWGAGNPPQYPPVTITSGNANGLNIVNNTSVEDVISGWNEVVAANNAAQSSEDYKRYPTNHKIRVTCNSRINICLDNIWTTYEDGYEGRTSGALSFMPTQSNPTAYNRLNVYLKGDSRMGNVYYLTKWHAGDNPENPTQTYTNTHLIFRSADGNGATSGTLTVADIDLNNTHAYTLPGAGGVIQVPANHYNAVIGADDDKSDSRNIDFKGGTIYAGAVFDDNCSAIGAGGNGVGIVNIDGGQITAVTSSTGTAIGGGIGWKEVGGEGHVTINGGTVYAYNHGTAWIYEGVFRYVPATAIGGGSSFRIRCNPCTVNINGGNVYAQSVGGVTIGGGGSGLQSGGDGTVVITGGTITAKSISGTVTNVQQNQSIEVPAGAALGGGTGGLGTAYGGSVAYGGNATVNISGGTLYAGSVGGGAANDPNGKIGSATVNISGGTSQAQFIMAAGSTTHCSFTMTDGIVQNSNTSSPEFILLKPDGGAVWMDDPLGEASISGGTIRNCSATNGGAIYMTGGSFEISGGTVGGSSITDGNKATNYGGAVYMGGGTFEMTGGSIQYNKATNQDGGGFYIGNGGTVDIYGGTIKGNEALNGNGGGFYVNPGDEMMTTINSNIANTTISDNQAKYGGGAYMNSGMLYIASTNQTTTIGTNNKATYDGGGIYMHSGDVEITSAKLEGNMSQSGNGGGLYVEDGDITLSGAIVSGNKANNGKGGGIYAGNGDIEVIDGTQIGTYTTSKETSGLGNEAKEGGGLYVNDGNVVFSNGTFADNYASEKGGGIYIKEGATLNLRSAATLTRNHVPEDGQGGGVYMDGTLNVGQNAGDAAGTHSLMAHDNYAGTTGNYTLNNIFLPDETKYITLLSDISGVNPATNTYYTRLGFSVTRGFCPVVYTDITGSNASHEAWLQSLMGSSTMLTGAIFDDANKYPALHLPEDHGPILAKYIWLWGCWTTEVDANPGTDHFTVDNEGTDEALVHIKSNRGLAWFSSYVNGLNGCAAHHDVDAVLEADVDMDDYLWVPIGAVSAATVDPTTHQTVFTDGGYYSGTFDGQGYVISGLQSFYLNAIPKIGMFGYLNNATVKNTFVDDYWFMSTYNDESYYIGGIAGIAEGTTVLSNSEARGQIETNICGANSYMGGLVGKVMEGATVHSSMAMPVLSGAATYTGGLVGGLATANNTLKNSYAYPMFGTTTNNVGGLVGVNNGTVENCYVRLQPDCQTSKLGLFASTNNGTIQYCYAPEGETTYTKGGDGLLDGCGNYGETALVGGKYGYEQEDQQIDPEEANGYVINGVMGNDGELTGLLATLNSWVEEEDGLYSMWTRTMASPINDDYPILEFEDYVAALSEDNIFISYRNNLDDLIDQANANSDGGIIYLYKSLEEEVNSSTGENVRVYIDPDASLLQAEASMLNARVGVVFDNDADNDLGGAGYDWHMFSTPLADAPLGITYNDTETHYYGYVIPATNITLGSEGYFPANTPFNSFDFYCYNEQYYHWINFKRHSNDHWHQDEPHAQIPYNNEDSLLIGKGYMMAVDQPTMLMSEGVLNNGDAEAVVTYSNALNGYEAPLRGVNLVGNPYQSYLDATAFLETNGLNTYYILDANANGYIAYTKGGSTDHVVNPSPNVVSYNVIAPAFIHPHQGFFVRVPEGMTKVDFNNDMRAITGGTFRNANVNYPMVNMICSDANGYNDFATIELDRPDMGGGEKIKDLRTGDASIWFSMDDKDWQIAFAPMGTTSAPLRFEAHSDGVYTMRWTTANGDFSYLHLVDHVTGADVDCLATSEYRFEATTHDYQSRFNVVFEFTGVDENSTSDYDAFAFMMDDELVVNGEGVLQVFDVNGRMLKSIEVNGTQTTISLPDAANGVYVLRLTNNSEVRIQKMVINK